MTSRLGTTLVHNAWKKLGSPSSGHQFPRYGLAVMLDGVSLRAHDYVPSRVAVSIVRGFAESQLCCSFHHN